MTVFTLKLITPKLGLAFQHFVSGKTGPSWPNTWREIIHLQRLRRKRHHRHAHTIWLTSTCGGTQCINTSVSLLPPKRVPESQKKDIKDYCRVLTQVVYLHFKSVNLCCQSSAFTTWEVLFCVICPAGIALLHILAKKLLLNKLANVIMALFVLPDCGQETTDFSYSWGVMCELVNLSNTHFARRAADLSAIP